MASARDQDGLPEGVALALEAFQRAQQESHAGHHAAALRWLDRAHRLAPQDQTLALALATACLGRDDKRAVALLTAITAANDVREAWLGLAAACRRRNDPAGAAQAVAAALRRHVPAGGLPALAEAIVREAGEPGWCGLSGGGRLMVHNHGATPCRIALASGFGEEARRIRVAPSARESAVAASARESAVASSAGDAAIRLPRAWKRAASVSVTTEEGVHLLGSPIDIAAITATVGCVETADGGLQGWAWNPGDPDTDPVLTIRPLTGSGQIRLTAADTAPRVEGGLLARPRGFVVPAARLAGMQGALRVLDRSGRDLLGSPLDPRKEAAAATAAAATIARLYPAGRTPAPAPDPVEPPALPVLAALPVVHRSPNRRPPGVAVVIPVHGVSGEVLACLESVLASLPGSHRLIVVDDASPETATARVLRPRAREKPFRLIRSDRNQGFAASANTGILAAAGRDVVLLNSDTLVAPGWLEDLRAAAYSAPDIGTVTPLSNDATILSYPNPAGDNDRPDLAATAKLAALARHANGGRVVDIPVGIGFCLYIRRACLDEVGLLRADLFAQGYGEENDFCLRARHFGWRHVAAPGVYVAHVGGHSFGAAARHLRARNGALLERLHPGYARLVEAHVAADPLAPARRRLDLARWRAARPRHREAVILITHASGGGVERLIEASVRRHRGQGRRAIVLRPSRAPDGTRCATLGDGTGSAFPNLRYALPGELPALQRLLAREHPHMIELHHTMGHHPSVLELLSGLAAPYDVHVHDYAWLCARVALVGAAQRYCGEPDSGRCANCVADAGSLIDEEITVEALRRRSARLLAGARRVVVPTEDGAARIRRHFPATHPLVRPHEDDTAIADPPPLAARSGHCRVCVVGAIGIHKGYQVVLECARDAADRQLPLDFVIVGHSIDDRRLLATGRVFITGSYAQAEAVGLIRAQQATLALLPSIFPETWCLGLGEAWRAGLRVAAFDIGAQAERIRRTGRGFLLPLGLPAEAINNALIAAAGLSRHE